MKTVPAELRYSSSHEWVHQEDDGTIVVGITDFAQQQLGDIVFVELPELDTEVTVDNEAGVVESVKAASDIYSPLTGTIIAINEKVIAQPELINQDPYGEGWLFKMTLEDEEEINDLMDADEYQDHLNNEEH